MCSKTIRLYYCLLKIFYVTVSLLNSKKQKKRKFNSLSPNSSLLSIPGIETSEDTQVSPDIMNLSLNFTIVWRKEKQYLHRTHSTAKKKCF